MPMREVFAQAGSSVLARADLTTLAFAPGATESVIGRFYRWMATNGLEIVIWILGGILVVRFIRWSAQKFNDRIEAKFHDSDLIVQSEDSKHRRAMIDVVSWTLVVVVGIIVFLHILTVFKVPLSGLVGPTAVVGAALGFGAQRVVQDILAGFFVVAERQYGYGDVVALTVTGNGEAEGTVEDVTLRITRLRTSEGEVITVPNGQVIKTTNRSKDWARAVVDVPVPADSDIGVVNEVLSEVGQRFYNDPYCHDLLLDAPSPLGVTNLELDSMTVRMVTRTLPGKQFEVSRALRAWIVRALARRGINVASGKEVQAGSAPPSGHAEADAQASSGGDK